MMQNMYYWLVRFWAAI